MDESRRHKTRFTNTKVYIIKLTMLCRRLPREIILFAYKLVVVQNVQLFARRQLFSTHETCKAVEMENLFSCFTNEVGRWYAVTAAAALCPVTSAGNKYKLQLVFSYLSSRQAYKIPRLKRIICTSHKEYYHVWDSNQHTESCSGNGKVYL